MPHNVLGVSPNITNKIYTSMIPFMLRNMSLRRRLILVTRAADFNSFLIDHLANSQSYLIHRMQLIYIAFFLLYVSAEVSSLSTSSARKFFNSNGKLNFTGQGNCPPTIHYVYEHIPPSQENTRCIGASTGEGFRFHAFSTTVKTLRVWTGGEHNGFRAIYVQLFNDEVGVFGTIPAEAPSAEITFGPGEYITGSMIIGGNGIGTRAGYLHFKTSAGQEFAAGTQHTPYFFSSGESFLTGIIGKQGPGKHGNEIYNLGLMMMKSVKSGRMFNLNYPTLESYNQGLQPQVYKGSFCNIGNVQQTQKATFTKREGEKRIWTNSISFEVGMSITVEGGVPGVYSVKGEFKWKLGTSSTYTREVETTRTQQMEFPVVVPAQSSVSAQFTWFDSKVNLPYTAVLEYTFTDGTISRFNVDGIFDGAYISNVNAIFETKELNGESC